MNIPPETYYNILKDFFSRAPWINAWLECERFSIEELTIEEAIKEIHKRINARS